MVIILHAAYVILIYAIGMQLLNDLPLMHQVPKYEEKQVAGYYLYTYSLKLIPQHSCWRPSTLLGLQQKRSRISLTRSTVRPNY